MTWNKQQREILEDAERGDGDTVVIARAGTGKTTTMLAAAARFPRGASAVFLAFNSRIREEVSPKAPPGLEVRTIHSLGRGALYVYAKGRGKTLPEPAEQKTRRNVERLWPALFERRGDRLVPRAGQGERVSSLCAAASFAKNTLAQNPRDVRKIVCRLDLDVGTDPLSPGYEQALENFCRDVLRLLTAEIDRFREHLEYDFDDMIWIPVQLRLRTKSYDRLIVDEGQDLNACQHALVRAARRRGGRIILVGDDRQAIYGWRGADEDGLHRFQRELGARVLRLPVTYRCGRAIVNLARTIVPDYEAAPTNGPGEISRASERQMVADARPGDAILSRTNAPLLGACLEILRAGRRARVVGRDVGKKILALLADAQRAGAETVPALVAWVESWRRAEVERVEARDGNPEPIHDRAECVLALAEGHKTVADVILSAEDLFTDAPGREEIVLSSTHRAKGLEWRTVWCLEETYRPGQGTEEDNLLYVAVTRAIDRLVLVRKRLDDETAPAPTPDREPHPQPSAGGDSLLVEALLRGETVECWVPRPGEPYNTAWRVAAA